jgi:hypothetical protein
MLTRVRVRTGFRSKPLLADMEKRRCHKVICSHLHYLPPLSNRGFPKAAVRDRLKWVESGPYATMLGCNILYPRTSASPMTA